MNREIKFRAWDGKEMIYLPFAGLQYFDFEGSYALSFVVDGYGDFWAHEQYDTMSKEAAKFPIMQFTGLHDKNRDEIYEGDIVAIPLYGNTIILWNEDICSFQYAYNAIGKGTSVGGRMTNTLYKHKNDDYEIIGNIFQNPELINQ